MTDLKLIEKPSLIHGVTFKALSRPLNFLDFESLGTKFDLRAFEVFDWPEKQFKKSLSIGDGGKVVSLRVQLQLKQKTLQAFGGDIVYRLARMQYSGRYLRDTELQQWYMEADNHFDWKRIVWTEGLSRCRTDSCRKRKTLKAAEELINSVSSGQFEHLMNEWNSGQEKLAAREFVFERALENVQGQVEKAIENLNRQAYDQHLDLLDKGDDFDKFADTAWREDLRSLYLVREEASLLYRKIVALEKSILPVRRRIGEHRREFLAEQMARYKEKHGDLPRPVYDSLLERVISDDELLPPKVRRGRG